MPRPNASAYAAAIEGREHGIAVCCLHPGNVDIETRGPGRIHSEPMMEVADAAVAVAVAAMLPNVNLYQAIILPLGVCPRIRSWRRKPPRNNLLTVIWTLSWSN